MKNWRRERWRRLYLRESAEQAALWSLMQRGVQAYCVKVAEDDGTVVRIRPGQDSVDLVVAVLRARPREIDLAREAVIGLIDDGFLEVETDRVVVANLPAAQDDDQSEPDDKTDHQTQSSRSAKTPAERQRDRRNRERAKRDAELEESRKSSQQSVTQRHETSRESVTERHENERDTASRSHVTASRGNSQEDPPNDLLANQNNQKNQTDLRTGARDVSTGEQRDTASRSPVTRERDNVTLPVTPTVTAQAERTPEDDAAIRAAALSRPANQLSSAARHELSFMQCSPPDRELLEVWAERFNKTDVIFTADRTVHLTERRTEGITQRDALDAIEGAAASPWFLRSGAKFSLIFNKRERFEEFRDAGRSLRNGPAPEPLSPRAVASAKSQADHEAWQREQERLATEESVRNLKAKGIDIDAPIDMKKLMAGIGGS